MDRRPRVHRRSSRPPHPSSTHALSTKVLAPSPPRRLRPRMSRWGSRPMEPRAPLPRSHRHLHAAQERAPCSLSPCCSWSSPWVSSGSFACPSALPRSRAVARPHRCDRPFPSRLLPTSHGLLRLCPHRHHAPCPGCILSLQRLPRQHTSLEQRRHVPPAADLVSHTRLRQPLRSFHLAPPIGLHDPSTPRPTGCSPNPPSRLLHIHHIHRHACHRTRCRRHHLLRKRQRRHRRVLCLPRRPLHPTSSRSDRASR